MAKRSSSSSSLLLSPLSILLPRSGDNLFYLIALFSISSLLIHHLTLASSSSPPHFEGFEADELEDDVTPLLDSNLPLRSPPPTTTLSPSPESHHGPPSPSPSPSPLKSKPSLDDWDEDEFEGIPPSQLVSETLETTASVSHSGSDSDSTSGLGSEAVTAGPKGVKDYYVEIISVSFLLMFLMNYFTGKRENENLALAWAMKFAGKDSIFDKNFSLLGVGEGEDSPLLLKEGQSTFRFYASGRRFCQGLLATMELKSRHDLMARLYNAIVPCKDEITIEVPMNDEGMDHIVFALARKKLVKTMQKEVRDLQRFAVLVAPPSGRKWVADELAVVAESKEVAGDMITETVLEQVFGDKAFEKLGRFFISMHFSDHYPGSQRKMLVFKFALPDIKYMADMTRLVALVPYYIDQIGRYKLSSHAKSKTDAVRQKIAQEIQRELLNARQEDLKKRKVEARKKLEEAEAKLSAESLRKKEAKERARQMKKAMPKMKMTRAG